MKKIISILVITIIVVSSLSVPIFATSTTKVFDNALIFTESETAELQEDLDIFTSHYGIGLYFATISDPTLMNGRSSEQYAADLVELHAIESSTPDSLVLLYDFVNNTIMFYTIGNGMEIFDQPTQDAIFNDMNSLVSGVYYPGFAAAISRCAAAASAYTGLEAPVGIVPVEHDGYDPLIDDADLFTEEEEAILLARIEEIKATYDFDYTVLTVTDTGSVSLESYTNDFRGVDDYTDGVVFSRNPISREYITSARNYGETVFTWPDAFDEIDDIVVPYLREDQTFDAYMAHMDFTVEILDLAAAGTPYKASFIDSIDPELLTGSILGGIVISLIISLLVTGGMIAKMKTAVKQTHAQNYIREGSFNLTDNRDVFVTEYTTKTRKASESSGGGGGGSSSNSFGGSRTSGGGRA